MTQGEPFRLPVTGGVLSGLDRAGGETALVLLHGFSFDKAMWSDQIDCLNEVYRVVAYDLRGFGQSGRPRPGHSHLSDLSQLVAGLQLDQAVLVGLSLGANVALAYALEHAERVRALVLASPGLPGATFGSPRPPDEAADVARRHGITAAKEYWKNHDLFAPARASKTAEAALASMIERFPAHQWTDKPQGPAVPSVMGRIEDLTVPTLILSGAMDLPIYESAARYLEATIPSARREVSPTAGHIVNLEDPKFFNAAIDRFVRNLPPTT